MAAVMSDRDWTGAAISAQQLTPTFRTSKRTNNYLGTCHSLRMEFTLTNGGLRPRTPSSRPRTGEQIIIRI